MKTIPLTRGLFVKVDDEDYKKFAIFRWHAQVYNRHKGHYRASRYDGKRFVYLYREILKAPKGKYIDHINGDTLDDRKRNLRFCTLSQNNMNQITQKRKKASKYKGVSLNKNKYKKWRAYIKINQKQIWLGNFYKEKNAALAYDKKAKELFGEFAKLNFNQPVSPLTK